MHFYRIVADICIGNLACKRVLPNFSFKLTAIKPDQVSTG